MSGRTTQEAEALEFAVIEANAAKQGSWLDLFRSNYPRRCGIALLVLFLNQCAGSQFINLYGPT